MSDPLSRFQGLRIDGMAETRAQRRREQQRAGTAAGSGGRGQGRAGVIAQPPRLVAPIHGHSGMLYYTQRLPPDSASRANEGLGSDFFVDQLQRHGTGHGTYYAFQLKKPVSVRIYEPANGTSSVKCTCGDQTPCIHVYWLFDGLRAVFKTQALSSPYDISVEAMVPNEISELYDRIGESVVTLRHELNTTRGSEGDSDTDEDTVEEASVSSGAEARASVVIDMLSVFDNEKLPDEYESEFPEVSMDSAFEDALIPGNLAATIYGLAVREETFCVHLRKLINRDVCADYYLTKQRRRAQRAISKLNEPSNDPSIRVYECGDTLRRIVREVCWDREARTSKRPLGSRILNKAAELLVDILELVCKQNRNIATLASAFPSPDTDANLYTYLISDPPRFEEGDFVIDQLRKFPQNEWRHLLEYLTTVADYVRNNAPESQLRSVQYAENIEAMVNDYTSSAFEPSSSSHRRPTTSGDRESQRRRYI